ncbi:hypothetical protein MTR67_021860 [Solanum verrucosum]|uniref:NB-ARC domain-containing protein n=1 Tax=Solanum verrucosum TaxID=315347 RepID=A0AAF0QTM3_SOLVR|nr:hypothetical protein MTR67_021860 [Solanum verrucosum]
MGSREPTAPPVDTPLPAFIARRIKDSRPLRSTIGITAEMMTFHRDMHEELKDLAERVQEIVNSSKHKVGMPGLGKTTLAEQIYNDQIVSCYFDIHDDQLAKELRQVLLRKRFLILIDDVWDTKAWDYLHMCFQGIGFGINQHWLYLEVLKLLNKAFEGVQWNVNDPELKYVKLDSLNFAQWSISEDSFPSLERLVLTNCKRHEKIPSYFEDVVSLKSIEVNWCSWSVANSAEEIQTTQRENMANDAFTVTIQPPDWNRISSP